MAKKIPVGAAIAHAYGFSFGQYWHLLKRTWPLMLAVTAINVWIGPQMAGFAQGLASHDYSGMTVPGFVIALAYLVMLLLSVMWFTGIYQIALGRPEADRHVLYFSLGKPMWRLIGAFALMILSLFGILLAYVIAVAIILYGFRLGFSAAHISDNALKGIAVFDLTLAFLIGCCGLALCALRFGFLLFAVTLAEGRIGLFRSWTLSHGNFWRMFWILLAVTLPLIILETLAFYWLGLFAHIQAGMSQADMQAAQQAASAAAFAKMHRYWYVVYPGGMILSLWVYAVTAGAQSFSYRALTQDAA
jgi:hypothetical protein